MLGRVSARLFVAPDSTQPAHRPDFPLPHQAVRKEANFDGTLAINQTLVTPKKGIFVAQLGSNIVPVATEE